MHHLSLEIKYGQYPDNPASRRKKYCLAIECAVNGNLIADWHSLSVDILALLASAKKPGMYFIWTCTCGFPECAGISQGIEVTHRPDVFVWKNKGSKPKVKYYEFEKNHYIQTIHQALEQYTTLAEEYLRRKENFDLALYGQDIERFLDYARRQMLDGGGG